MDVSQGTLLALAILTLAYLPDPPPVVGLEEPGRGIHPRLLREVRDAMYRLAYPESCGEDRDPVQVIATTHPPYMVDLFREHPEEIVIANKVEGVYAGLCHDVFSAERLKKSNDANVLTMGARVIGPELAKMVVDAWLSSSFAGGGSAPKVEQMRALEQESFRK